MHDLDDEELDSDEDQGQDEASARALLAQLHAIGASVDSSERQDVEDKPAAPLLTPNQSSSSPFITISPQNQNIPLLPTVRIAQPSACDGDDGEEVRVDVPNGEHVIGELWGEGRVTLGPGFQLVAKKEPAEDDSPENIPKKVR